LCVAAPEARRQTTGEGDEDVCVDGKGRELQWVEREEEAKKKRRRIQKSSDRQQ
jgi:hypothetical protein